MEKKIKNIQKAKKLIATNSRKEVAEQLGVDEKTIYNYGVRKHKKIRKVNDFRGVKPLKDLKNLKINHSEVLTLTEYQLELLHNQHRYRIDNKCRRNGTSVISIVRECLSAIFENKDKVFTSSSERNVANLRDKYLFPFIYENFEIEMVGKKDKTEIISADGSKVFLHWLPPNPRTIEGFTGDVLLDEFSNMYYAEEIFYATQPMALQEGNKMLIICTSVGQSHFSYKLWKGENNGNPFHAEFHRNQVTLEDAIRMGCKHLNFKTIKASVPEKEFRRTWLCQWPIGVDHGLLEQDDLEQCKTNSEWKPFLGAPLIMGIDPNGVGKAGDPSGVVIVEYGEKISIVCAKMFKGNSEEQMEIIINIIKQYQIATIIVDAQWTSNLMYHEIQKKYPNQVFPFLFNQTNLLIFSGILENLIARKKVKFYTNQKELLRQFAAVKKTTTPSGKTSLVMPRQSGNHGELFYAFLLTLGLGMSQNNNQPAAELIC